MPLVFMGEEYGETAPFPYFTSHGDPSLASAVRRGREAEMAELGFAAEPPDPQDEATFQSAKLDWRLRQKKGHTGLLGFYRELLHARRENAAFSAEATRQVVAFEDERLLFVRRWTGDAEVFSVYHFGDHPVTFTLPVPSGTFRRTLASAEARFDGPGARAPEEVVSTGLVRMSLASAEHALYTRIR
jgi:maltooligosyltrehalose trehalohydrolase